MKKHHQEREKTEHIEFRVVEPRGRAPRTLEGSDFRSSCGEGRQYSILAESLAGTSLHSESAWLFGRLGRFSKLDEQVNRRSGQERG